MRVNYKRVVQSAASMKYPNQSGLSLTIENDKERRSVLVEGVNPKLDAVTSHLKLRIPFENIDDVVSALTEIKKNIKDE